MDNRHVLNLRETTKHISVSCSCGDMLRIEHDKSLPELQRRTDAFDKALAWRNQHLDKHRQGSTNHDRNENP